MRAPSTDAREPLLRPAAASQAVPVHDLLSLLGPARTTSTAALATTVGTRSIGRWIASGRLVRLHPGWVTVPDLVDDWTVRCHAAAGYAGGPLSHISALALHGIVDNEVTKLHVTVPSERRVRSSRWLRVHRSHDVGAVVQARGLPVTSVPRSLLDTWGEAHRARAMRGFDGVVRDAVLRATRERRVAVDELLVQVDMRPELPGRSALTELLGFIAGGCESRSRFSPSGMSWRSPARHRASSSTARSCPGDPFGSMPRGRRRRSPSNWTVRPSTAARRRGSGTCAGTLLSPLSGGWCCGSAIAGSCASRKPAGRTSVRPTGRASALSRDRPLVPPFWPVEGHHSRRRSGDDRRAGRRWTLRGTHPAPARRPR